MNWPLARTIFYRNSVPLLFVPVKDHRITVRQQLRMVFFKDPYGQVTSTLFIMTADDAYLTYTDYMATFTGSILQFDWQGQMTGSMYFENGNLAGFAEPGEESGSITFRDPGRRIYVPMVPVEGTFYPNSNEHWTRIGIHFFTNETLPPNPPSGSYPPAPGGGGGSGSGGGTAGVSLQTLYNMQNYELEEIEEIAALFMDELNIKMSLHDFLVKLDQLCPTADDSAEAFANLLAKTKIEDMPECVRKAVLQDRTAFLQIEEINLTTSQLIALTPEAIAFLSAHPQDAAAQKAVKSIFNIIAQGWLTGPYPVNQRDAIIQMYGFEDPAFYADYILNCVYLKQQHPDWSNLRIGLEAYWMTTIGAVHTALDICGLIPVGGEPCDLVNGVLYVVEGDGVNAGLSFAATLPIVGWLATGGKYAQVAVKILGKEEVKILKLERLVDGTISFGVRADLRTVMNITDSANDAHHVIPWGKQTHPLVQEAAAATGKPFHMNHIKNGKEVKRFRFDQPDGLHANHPQYDIKVQNKMDEVWQELINNYGGAGNIPPEVASQRLRDLQNYIGSVIDANPSIKINELNF